MIGLGKAFLVLALLLVGNNYFKNSEIIKEEFLQHNLFYRWFYSYVAIAMYRVMCEFVWMFINSSLIFCGYAYNGRDEKGNILWDKCTNVHILKVEFGTNPREIIANWNIQIACWLRHYCYERLESVGPFVSMLSTNLLSAFWHGIALGYFLSFFLISLVIDAAKIWRKKARPLFVKDENDKTVRFLYDVFTCFVTLNAFTYSFLPFMFLTVEESYRGYKALHFIPFFLIILWRVSLFFIRFPKVPSTNTNEGSNQTKEKKHNK